MHRSADLAGTARDAKETTIVMTDTDARVDARHEGEGITFVTYNMESVATVHAVGVDTGNGSNGSANAQLVDDACRIDIKCMRLHTMENMPILIDTEGKRIE